MPKGARSLEDRAEGWLNSAKLHSVDVEFDGIDAARKDERKARVALEHTSDAALRALVACEVAIRYVRRAKLREKPDEPSEVRSERLSRLATIHTDAGRISGEVQRGLAQAYQRYAERLSDTKAMDVVEGRDV